MSVGARAPSLVSDRYNTVGIEGLSLKKVILGW